MTVRVRFEKKYFNNDNVTLFQYRALETCDFAEEDFLWFAMSRQWRKKYVVISIIRLPLLTGPSQSWKLCLNLFSRKWLKPTRNFLSSLIPWGLNSLKATLGHDIINSRMFFKSNKRFWVLNTYIQFVSSCNSNQWGFGITTSWQRFFFEEPYKSCYS